MANPLLAFCLRLLGITSDHWAMIDQKPGGRRALYQLFAPLVASIAFGCAVCRFGVTFMHWDFVPALLLGVAIGLILFVFDLHMFDQLRTTVDDTRRAVVLRYARRARYLVLAISILGNIVLAVDHSKPSIVSQQKSDAKALRAELAKDPRYAGRLQNAVIDKERALAQIGKIQEIENELAARRLAVIEANKQLQDELAGAETPDGIRRIRGPGPKSRGFESHLAALSSEIGALESRKASLGDPKTVLQKADEDIANVNKEIEEEVTTEQDGSTQMMEAFIALAIKSPFSTLFPFTFLQVVLLLADILLLAAYANAMTLCPNEQAVANAIDRDWTAQIMATNAQMRKRRGEQLDEMQVRYQAGVARPIPAGVSPIAGVTERRNTTQPQPEAQAEANNYSEAA